MSALAVRNQWEHPPSPTRVSSPVETSAVEQIAKLAVQMVRPKNNIAMARQGRATLQPDNKVIVSEGFELLNKLWGATFRTGPSFKEPAVKMNLTSAVTILFPPYEVLSAQQAFYKLETQYIEASLLSTRISCFECILTQLPKCFFEPEVAKDLAWQYFTSLPEDYKENLKYKIWLLNGAPKQCDDFALYFFANNPFHATVKNAMSLVRHTRVDYKVSDTAARQFDLIEAALRGYAASSTKALYFFQALRVTADASISQATLDARIKGLVSKIDYFDTHFYYRIWQTAGGESCDLGADYGKNLFMKNPRDAIVIRARDSLNSDLRAPYRDRINWKALAPSESDPSIESDYYSQYYAGR